MSVRGFTRAGHFPTLIAAFAVRQAGVDSYRSALFGAGGERAA